jgi:molybdopterin-biosynthesis enzyme MoeA-like protein
VLEVPGTWVPLVNLRGIYVLPGIPRLFRSMLEAHADRFAGPAYCQAELLTDMGEGDLAGGPRRGPRPAR